MTIGSKIDFSFLFPAHRPPHSCPTLAHPGPSFVLLSATVSPSSRLAYPSATMNVATPVLNGGFKLLGME